MRLQGAARCLGYARPQGVVVNKLLLFIHLIGAIVWMGGMSLVLLALRPAALRVLEPPLRQQLMLQVLRGFFPLVWLSIALLLGSGAWALAGVGMAAAPPGWHAMLGIGLLMTAVFAHLYFAPYRRACRAAREARWPEAGAALQRIHRLVQLNFALGWLAIALVVLL